MKNDFVIFIVHEIFAPSQNIPATKQIWESQEYATEQKNPRQ
jgi:hypothetical protein